jgi:uncharacterized membrane protein YhaH (DUF805 family)
MNFQEAITSCFRRYADFNGRSARSEFWYFYLLNIGIGVVFGLLEVIVLAMSGGQQNAGSGVISILSDVVSFALVLPGLSVFVRRMHDTNRSGWWYFLALTIVGIIPLIIWAATRGTIGENRFGPDPLGGESFPAKPDSAWAS